jgi:homocysteine S-methyltransferase
MRDPLAALLAGGRRAVLDGGLATELEARGFDLRDALWSARLLKDAPEAIAAVHRAYLEAGADVITSASYQASVPGFVRAGSSEAEAERLLARSVELALGERDAHERRTGRRALVAASVGPYGAFRADGSEYTGAYDQGGEGLVAFHRDRARLLVSAGADLLACETVPSLVEARALVRVLDEIGRPPAWISFSCRDAARLSDGTPFADAVREVSACASVVAAGVNCTAPEHALGLLRAAVTAASVPLAAYPNSGETWDAVSKTWGGRSDPADWGLQARAWSAAGARLVGGCCRTGPAHVRAVAAALKFP